MGELRVRVAFIGSVGVPNCYGGFESFVDNCGPLIAEQVESVVVTCDAAFYSNKNPVYKGVHRIFLPIAANGPSSIFHDLLAFFVVFNSSTHIVVLGVSGGPWFPLYRILCDLFGKRLIVNVDGVEWRRKKFGVIKRLFLKCFDWFAQAFTHVVVYDNDALGSFIYQFALGKSVMIPYSGDHIIRKNCIQLEPRSALTICRIEPENNIETLIQGALDSSLLKYTIVGNWNASEYGKSLRMRYQDNFRLHLMDPIYDQNVLCKLRERCEIYLHGHSVGGTNPSLVEMLFYDCYILCFDVAYNRATAGNCAAYFNDFKSLSNHISQLNGFKLPRNEIRNKYMRKLIAKEYLRAMLK